MIYSVVTMIIKDGKMEEFLNVCKKLRPLVLAEQGCMQYDYVKDIDIPTQSHQEAVNENRITLYEKWESMDALHIHSQKDYMKEYGKNVSSLRDSVTIRTGTNIF